MHSSPAPVVVIGDALIDELRFPDGNREFVGGAALNVAVGLALLRVPTTLVAMVGDDEAGDRIRRFLADAGVGLIASPAPHGSSRAVSDRTDGEPTYVFNEAAQKRRVEFDAEVREAIAAAPFVVVSCFPFDDAGQARQLAASVTGSRRRLIVDPNPREGMLHSRERFIAGFESVAPSCLLVKVGDDDAELLYGTGLPELVERLDGLGVEHVLATAGKDGAWLRSDGQSVSRPIAEMLGPVIDTMGAGDAVLAAAVQHLAAHGEPGSIDGWGAVLERAMLVAAATCRSEGALLREPTV
ncbi:fructokinase [Paramicrobacterium humi]|uniref:Fructokinase n=1 Tax=Paramicrobacterium humi TaxID=640635 RepID=A0A1H4JBL6_9MICO|nr:PfkB family carbohydrate kinase [Microbacterium humi]SEB43749.1 fructokinase [Microbacterium humi]